MPELYARVFTKILDSSLAEDWQTRHVFEDLLKLADDGIVDMTREAISRRTNIPLEIVRQAIDKLEKADPASRDPQAEGRRIVRMDGHRDWGWYIVNWDTYANIKSREDARDRVRKYRSKFKPNTKQPELGLPPRTPPESSTDLDLDLYTQGVVTKGVTGVTVTPVTPEDVYDIYPRKEKRQEGLKAISKAMQKHDPQMLLEKTKLYAEAIALRGPDGLRWVPYPSSFYNQERFLEDPAIWRQVNQPVNVTPAWKQIEDLQHQIDNHTANPSYAGHLPERVTPELKADYEAKKARLAQLKSQQ